MFALTKTKLLVFYRWGKGSIVIKVKFLISGFREIFTLNNPPLSHKKAAVLAAGPSVLNL